MSLCAGGNCCVGRVRHYSKRDTFSVPTGVHQSANAGRVLCQYGINLQFSKRLVYALFN
jgi:hypothetical protein